MVVVGGLKIEVERRMLEELEGFDKSPAVQVAKAATAVAEVEEW